jgi:putative hemolysin
MIGASIAVPFRCADGGGRHRTCRFPLQSLRQDLDPEVPALIKGYLRCGARVLGEPAWDPDFRTADLPLMMRFVDLPPRYRKHFLGA